MATHTVTLTYGPNGFQPDPDPLLVKSGDTISFQLGVAPPSCTFKITMNDPRYFSAAEASNSSPSLTVVAAAVTTYGCQLLDAGGNLLSGSGQPGGGGHVRPG